MRKSLCNTAVWRVVKWRKEPEISGYVGVHYSLLITRNEKASRQKERRDAVHICVHQFMDLWQG